MHLVTKHFGEIEIDEKNIITFEDGLPGFEAVKKFVMIQNPDPELPFHWLQGVDEPRPAFVITNPFLFRQDYEFDIPEKVLKQLEIKNKEQVSVYTIAVVPEDIQKMTINLRGPVILNMEQKKGKQILLESEQYEVKYYIFQETAKAASE